MLPLRSNRSEVESLNLLAKNLTLEPLSHADDLNDETLLPIAATTNLIASLLEYQIEVETSPLRLREIYFFFFASGYPAG